MTALRMIVAPGRSGSTALLRAFANHPDVTAMYQPIKDGLRHDGREEEDYRIYDHHPVFDEHRDKVFVVKEVVNWMLRGSPVAVFRTTDDMRRVRPVFLVREPLRTWRSHAKFDRSRKSLDHFLESFMRVCYYRERCAASDPGLGLTLTFERLLEAPHLVVERLCVHWGLRPALGVLRWSAPAEHNTWFAPFAYQTKAEDPRWLASVRASTTISEDAVATDDPAIDDADRIRLEAELVPAYRALAWQCAHDFGR